MKPELIFNRLWKDYTAQNPSALKIHNLFLNEGENVVNDHIAFRTLDYPEINIDALSETFINAGFIPKEEYVFKEKHLLARHFELSGIENAPRIFISQLTLSECSSFIQNTFGEAYKSIDLSKIRSEDLIFSGSLFKHLSWKIYNLLREESEYAAWFYVFGFRVNHFTISINHLKRYNNIVKVNEFLKQNGFILNTAGGEIKGTSVDLLQQSSTMADLVSVKFEKGIYEIPSCYYEFAQRYPDSEGNLFSGFIAKSADKIFESTNFYSKKNS